MKVVCLLGSPRKNGNSATVARYFITRAEKLGAQTESFFLNGLDIKGCQACNLCKTEFETCALNDGLAPVLEAAFHADILVMASPVYYGDVSAQLKTFIDRTYSYLLPGYIAKAHPNRLPKRKELVFILTQGHRDPDWFADILPRYQDIFHWTGFANTHPIRVVDVYNPGDADKRQDILEKAEALAFKLIGDENSPF